MRWFPRRPDHGGRTHARMSDIRLRVAWADGTSGAHGPRPGYRSREKMADRSAKRCGQVFPERRSVRLALCSRVFVEDGTQLSSSSLPSKPGEPGLPPGSVFAPVTKPSTAQRLQTQWRPAPQTSMRQRCAGMGQRRLDRHRFDPAKYLDRGFPWEATNASDAARGRGVSKLVVRGHQRLGIPGYGLKSSYGRHAGGESGRPRSNRRFAALDCHRS